MIEIETRKIKASSLASKKYSLKAYRSYNLSLRRNGDRDCIDYVEQKKDEGVSPKELFCELIREKLYKK